MMKHKGIRLTLVVIEVFIGLGAIGGGIAFLIGAFDQWLPVAWLQGTPFRDYTIPGLALAVVVGGGMVVAAATVFIQHEWAVLISAVAGMFMAGFEVVEVASVDSKAGNWLPLMAGVQALYFALGLAIFGLAASLWITEYRGQHASTRHMSHAS